MNLKEGMEEGQCQVSSSFGHEEEEDCHQNHPQGREEMQQLEEVVEQEPMEIMEYKMGQPPEEQWVSEVQCQGQREPDGLFAILLALEWQPEVEQMSDVLEEPWIF